MKLISPTNYSSRIKSYKKMILAMGLITLAAVFLYPLYKSSPKTVKEHHSVATSKNEITKIEDPKFYGSDNKEQPYTITAREGVEKTAGLMELDEVWADFKMQDNTYMQLKSDKADIYRNENLMNLKGHVNIVMDNGYVMNTASAKVLYKEKSVNGTEPVEVEGKSGRITAPAFQVTPNMQEIIFNGGRVHTILYNVKNNEKTKK